MRLTRPGLLVACTAAATLSCTAAAPAAMAQSTACESVVTDPAPLLSPAGSSEVEAAAAALAAEGDLFVRVWLIDSAGPVGLDGWAEDQLADCTSWQAPDGAARDDLVLLVVAMDDRTIGSYFGDRSAELLDGARRDVHGQMGPTLDGNPARGLVLGLQLYAEVIRADAAAALAAQQAAEDQAGGSALPWALGGAAVVGAGAVGGIALTKRRRRNALRDQAQAAKTASMSDWYDLEQQWETIAAGVKVMTQATHPDDGVAATMVQESDEAERALASVRDAMLALPDPADLEDQGQVDQAVRDWSSMAERVEAVRREVAEVEAAVTGLQQAREHGPARVEEASAAAGRAAVAVTDITSQGFRADTAQQWLKDATQAVEAARAAHAEGRFGDAVAAAATASERAEEATRRAGRIPQLSRELPGQADGLDRDARATREAAVRATKDTDELRARWRRTVWDDISDAAEQAADLAEQASALADTVRAAATDQDWDQALEALAEGHQHLVEAKALAAEPAQRHLLAQRELERVRDRFEEAREQLADATRMFADTRAEVGPYQSAVKAASRQLDTGAELLTGKPDPLRAAASADEAIAAITAAVSGAHQTIAAFDRATTEAEATIREGRRRLHEAEQARPRSASFRGDTNRANGHLREAEDALERDPQRAADRARRGLDLANEVIRAKRRERDRDRDDWRSTSTARRTSSGPFSAGSVLGGSPTRSASPSMRPSSSSSTSSTSGGGFSGGGSTKRGGFGGGGSSGF